MGQQQYFLLNDPLTNIIIDCPIPATSPKCTVIVLSMVLPYTPPSAWSPLYLPFRWIYYIACEDNKPFPGLEV